MKTLRLDSLNPRWKLPKGANHNQKVVYTCWLILALVFGVLSAVLIGQNGSMPGDTNFGNIFFWSIFTLLFWLVVLKIPAKILYEVWE